MKYLQSKYDAVYKRATTASRAMMLISMKKSRLTESEKKNLKTLREYAEKMFNASYRITRVMQKKNGVEHSKLKPLHRGLFKKFSIYKRMIKTHGQESATKFLVGDR